MRLIDADAFKEYLIQENEELKSHYDHRTQTALDEATKFELEKIDARPTAYDVDKVVEQIMEILCRNRYIDSEYDEGYSDGVENICEEVIEIVKKGGIE